MDTNISKQNFSILWL